ncbi:DNA topoisomerase IV subunit A [Clostridium sp. LBM24168]
MTTKTIIPRDNNIIKISIEEAMPDNYLPYAVEVAKDRALPDVRDGLKPVHRRIIYGAYMLKAFPDRPYYKSARIVGDILGKYHPHGDSSVYDAMVILAQNFTTRMPLIDGHGNWGSQDGDNAAAMRYTEARLTPIAMEMVKYIEDDVVNMVDNYSGSEKEPEVLPVGYPNLLVNGAFGIAVGLATNIPPHNLREVIDASVALINKPDLDIDGLMKYIKGPDLPTGGIIIGRESLKSAYSTGEGKVTLRAKTSIDKLENDRFAIIITEFPYRRSKAKLLQTISEMTADKKHSRILDTIYDIRDESDRTGIRAVIEFKKSVDRDGVEKILKYLFKKTDLQCSVSFNMVALADGKPIVLSLKRILQYFIKYQKDILVRRTKKELSAAKKRFHIVEGFIKAIGIMDDIIKSIRSSSSRKDASNNLVERFGFTKMQSEAILELMLYRLTGLEIVEFEKEHKKLSKYIDKLELILSSEDEQLRVIKSELRKIRDKYGDDRRSSIVEDDSKAKILLEEIIIEEDIVVTMSNECFIKKVSRKSYSRSSKSIDEIDYREGDYNRFLVDSNTRDTIMFFTDHGNMYQLKGMDIPEFKWKEKGEKLDNIIKGLDTSREKIVSVINLRNEDYGKIFMLFTSTGGIKKTSVQKFSTTYTKLSAIKLKKNEKLLDVKLVLQGRKEKFLNIVTSLGLDFTIPELKVDLEDRNIVSTSMFALPSKDRVLKVDFAESQHIEAFYVSIDKNGILKSSSSGRKTFGVHTDSSCTLLVFEENGEVFSIPSVMLQNIKDHINIEDLFGIRQRSGILKLLSVNNFNRGYMYFFTRNGMVKKTELSQFEGIRIRETAYKFKGEEDILTNVEFSTGENSDIVVFTQNGAVIRFSGSDINPTGKIASGSIAVNLKLPDKIIYSAVIDCGNKAYFDVHCKSGKELKLGIHDIKPQSRGGKGRMIVENDSIKNVHLKSL